MPAQLTTKAVERSTFVVSAVFTDSDGTAVTPSSIIWTLSDEHGRIMNSRDGEVVAAPASSIDVVLYGADLALTDAKDDGGRIVTFEAVYDSTEGSDLPLKEEVRFSIARLTNVS